MIKITYATNKELNGDLLLDQNNNETILLYVRKRNIYVASSCH